MFLSDLYLQAASSGYVFASIAGLALVQALLSGRAKHHTGFTVGLTASSVFMAKHLGLYAAHFRAVPSPVLSALAAYVFILLAIRLATFKPTAAYARGFPVQVYKPMGCTRVATDFNKRAKDLSSPVFDATVSDVRVTVVKWLKARGADIIVDKPDYLYARCYTRFMGFPDDIAIRIKPVAESRRRTVVDVQAELVLGRSDLNVNLNRVKDFISFLNFTRK